MPLILISALAGCGSQSTNLDRQGDRDAPKQSTIQPDPAVAEPGMTLDQIRAAYHSGEIDRAYSMATKYLISHQGDEQALAITIQCLVARNQPVQAHELLSELPEQSPTIDLEMLGQLADSLMQTGEVRLAESVFRMILDRFGNIPLAHSRLALLLNSQGRRFDAAVHLKTLAELQNITRRELSALVSISDQCSVERVPGTTGSPGQLVVGDLRRAKQLNMTGKLNESLELTLDLRERFPQSAPIAAFLGMALLDLQQLDQLPEWHETIPESTLSQPLYWTAMARWMSIKENHRSAIHCALQSIGRDPTNYRAFSILAQSLFSIGANDFAKVAQQRSELLRTTRTVFQQSVQNPRDANHYLALSESMLELNRPYEALGWLKEAAKLNAPRDRIASLTQRINEHQQPKNEHQWISCGLNLADFPSPDLDSIATIRQAIIADHADDDHDIAPIRLVDSTRSVGFKFQYDAGNQRDDGSYLLHHTMGGGIGVIDFDLDGYPDTYLSQAGGEAFQSNNRPNALKRNLNGKQFVDCAAAADVTDRFYGMGVTVCDYNQDGFPDLIVANMGPNSMFRNNGDGTFSQQDLPAWADRDYWTSVVGCADLSGDGLSELIECNYIDDPESTTRRCTPTQQRCAPASFLPSINRMLMGEANGHFARWPPADVVEQSANYSLGVIIANVDSRFGNDVFIANDTKENSLWISHAAQTDREHRFRLSEQARLRGCATGPQGELQGCMGIATGDFDRNGTFDLFVTNYYHEANNLYFQQRGGVFVDQAVGFSAAAPSVALVGFGTQAADFNCDGWLDIVVLNGHAVDRREKGEPLQMPPQLFAGQRGMVKLVDQDDPFWHMPTRGRALAILDFNRDGKIDFVAGHIDHPTIIVENATNCAQGLIVELAGTVSEREPVGAEVTVTVGKQEYKSWLTAGDGYFSTNESLLHFGIPGSQIDLLRVRWPSGAEQVFKNLQGNSRYLIVENAKQPPWKRQD